MDRLTARDEYGINRVCHYPYIENDALLHGQCYGCSNRTKCNADIFEKLASYEDWEEDNEKQGVVFLSVRAPKGEIVWVSYNGSDNKPMFIMTSKPSRDFYFLYEILESGELNKLGKARTPTELEEKFDVMSKIRA